jgi:hypothetical protein
MRFFLISLLLLAGMAACKKKDTPPNAVPVTSNAVLTGVDGSKCYCCFGVYVLIDGQTKLIKDLPGYTMDDFTRFTYPRPITLNWQPDDQCGYNKVIKVNWFRF